MADDILPDEELAAAPPVPSGNPYAATVARLYPKDGQTDDGVGAWLSWRAKNPQLQPEQALEVLRYSEASGMPAPYVAKNLESLRGSIDASKVDLDAVAQNVPELKQWLAGRQGLRMDGASNDLPPLVQLTAAVLGAPLAEALLPAPVRGGLQLGTRLAGIAASGAARAAPGATAWDTATDTLAGAGAGLYAGVRGLQASAHTLAGIFGADTSQEAEESFKAADQIQQQNEALRGAITNPVAKFVADNTEVLPMLGLDWGMQQLGGAFAAGLVGGGQVAAGGGPEDVPADVAGTVEAAAAKPVGEFGGSFLFNSGVNIAGIHQQLRAYRDANGRPLDPDLIRGVAILGGSLEAAGMASTGGLAGIGSDAGVKRTTAQMTERMLLDRTFLERAAAWGARAGFHDVVGTFQMGLLGAQNKAAELWARRENGENIDAGDAMQQVMGAFSDSYEQAATSMPLAAAVGASNDIRARLGQERINAQLLEQHGAMIDAARTSKVVAGAPAEAESLGAHLKDQPGAVQGAYVDKTAWDRLWQNEHRSDPREAATAVLGDDGAAYDRAKETGELRIPTEKYIPFLKTDAARALFDDIRLDGQDKTPNQARAAADVVTQRMGELAKLDPSELDDSAQRVYQDLADKLGHIGKDDQPNLAASKLMAAKAQAVAERFARDGTPMTAWEAYEQFRPRIVDEHGEGLPAGNEDDASFDFGANEAEERDLPVAEGVDVKSGVVPTEGAMQRAGEWADTLRSPERKQAAHDFLGYVRGHLSGDPEAQRPQVPNDIEDHLASTEFNIFDPKGYDAPEVRKVATAFRNRADAAQRAKQRRMLGKRSTLDQPAAPEAKARLDAVTAKLKTHFERLGEEGRQRAYQLDRNTQLLNPRGFRVAPRDPARPHLAEFDIEGKKFLNDVHGHAAVDGALRTMARVLHASGVPDGMQDGATVRGWVRDPAHAQEIAGKMAEAINQGQPASDRLQVTAGVSEKAGEGPKALEKAFEQAGENHKAVKAAGVNAGTLGDRLGVPSFAAKDPETAKARTAELAKRLADEEKNGPVQGLKLSPEHLSEYQKNKATAFDQTYRTKDGALTDDGYHLARELSPKKWAVSADLRGLRGLNDKFGKQGANVVLATFERAMMRLGGATFDVAHPHGDEYFAQGGSKDSLGRYFDDLKVHTDRMVFYKDLGDGRVAVQEGLQFAHGLGRTFDEADRIELPRVKAEQGPVAEPSVISRADYLDLRSRLLGREDEHDGVSAEPGPRAHHQFIDVGGLDSRGRAEDSTGAGGEAQGEVDPARGTYHQPAEGGTFRLDSKRGRGRIEFTAPGDGNRRFTIHLEKGADATTLTHELAHFFGDIVGELATREDAPADLRADYAAQLKFQGFDSHDQRLEQGAERRELAKRVDAGTASAEDQARFKHLSAKEERLSHAWEQYLAEGKAPTQELQGIFTRFRRWMTGIYRALKGGTPAQTLEGQFRANFGEEIGLTDSMRAVFDRWVAAEDAQRRAAERADLAAPFEALRAKRSPEEQRDYDRVLERRRTTAEDDIFQRLTSEHGKDEEFLKARGAELRPEVEKEIDQIPVYQALRYLEHGDSAVSPGRTNPLLADNEGRPYKLDRRDYVKRFGRDAADRLPAAAWAPKDLAGIKVEALAEMLGWDSASELQRQLGQARPRALAISDEVQRRVEEVHGPSLLDSPAKVDDRAMAAVHNAAAATKLLMERRWLQDELNTERARKAPGPDPVLIRRTAEHVVRNLSVRELTAGEQGAAGQYLRAERSASRATVEAYEKGRVAEALGHKDRQLMLLNLHRAARDLRAELEVAQRQVQSASRRSAQEQLGHADVAASQPGGEVDFLYRNTMNSVLEAVGARPPEAGAAPDVAPLNDLLKLVGTGDLGFDPDALRALISAPKSWGELGVDDALNVQAAVQRIRKAARDQLSLEIEGKKLSRKAMFDDMEEHAFRRVPPLPPSGTYGGGDSGRAWLDKVRGFGRGLDAWLTNVATYVHQLDGGDRNGPWHKMLDEHLDALVTRGKLDREVVSKFEDLLEALPKAARRRMNERVEGLDDILPVKLEHAELVKAPSTRADLATLYLRWGDAENRQRIIDGNGWSEAQVQAALNHLTPEEAEFLDGLHRVIDGLHPELAKVHERRTGTPLGKVEALPITVNGKTYGGGYFPIVYDARTARQANYQMSAVEEELFRAGGAPPRVFTGFTKERTNKVYAPVSLDFDVARVHLTQASHDIAMGDFVRKWAGVVLDGRAKSIILRRLGQERYDVLLPWLRDIAADRAGALATAVSGTPGAVRLVDTLTRKAGAEAMLGMNIASLALHLADPSKAIMAGNPSFWATPGRALRLGYAWTRSLDPRTWDSRPEFALSKEISVRDTKGTANLNRAMAELGGPTNSVARGYVSLRRLAGEGAERVRFLEDKFHTRVIWLAGFEDALAKGATQADAARQGDDWLSQSLPSGDVGEKSPLLRDQSALSKTAAFLGGYANKMWNLTVSRPFGDIADTWRDPSSTAWERVAGPADLAAKWIFMGVMDAGLKYLIGQGPDQNDDEKHKVPWLVRQVLYGPVGTVPLLGSGIQGAIERGKVDARTLPGIEGMSHLVERGWKLIDKAISDDGDSEVNADAWDAINLLFGLGTGWWSTSAKATSYGRAVQQGDLPPQGVGGVAKGVIYGPPRRR